MITVADIIALPSFDNVSLAAPCKAAETREVCNVGILDCPPDYNEYSTYVPKEFILSNLGFAYGNPELAERSLLAMLRRDVAAIAIKTVYAPPISDRVQQESSARGVPLYLYDGEYHEKVTYESLDLLRRDREGFDAGKAIDGLLKQHDGDLTRKKLHDVAGVTGSTMQCFSIALNAGDRCSYFATVDIVSSIFNSVKQSCEAVESVLVCPYYERMLAFVSFGSGDPKEIKLAEERCVSRLSLEGNVCCGVSEAVRSTDGDLAIRQALSALNVVEQRGMQVMFWRELHADAFADAARSSRMFMSASVLYRSLLENYDTVHSAELVVTARALVYSFGDIRVVAEELHQHPNTVRYRVRKMKTILGIPDASDKKLHYLLNLVFLPVFEEHE